MNDNPNEKIRNLTITFGYNGGAHRSDNGVTYMVVYNRLQKFLWWSWYSPCIAHVGTYDSACQVLENLRLQGKKALMWGEVGA